MSTLLAVVEAANTGVILWNAAGPLVEQMLKGGADRYTAVTQADLDEASVDLGHDLDDLQAAIDAKKARDAAQVKRAEG